ncbi:MAG: MarR family EPS-associated transcriptional regulator [Proteobacteria bacterium]|nr:MarR family EPS-associated transcriptional regulator [Pseudomonadota bacterium]
MNETEFKALKELSTDGAVSQRDLSKRVGLSLGGVNYIIKELIQKGYIKAQRFKNSNNKAAYIYAVTPQGINARVKQTQYFLQKKIEEYERLKMEIDELTKDNTETSDKPQP